MNGRKITSLTMLISFVFLVLTSIILYIVPHGRVAYWADWHLWGLTKNQWGNLHINLGFLFLLAGLLHIFYNWKPMVAYMKNRARQVKIFTPAFNIALVLTLAVGIGTLLNVPPMSTVIHFGESIKEAASKKYGEPPYGHAELSSLRLFARQTNLDLARAKELLTRAGIAFSSDDQTILEISKANNLSPKQLAAIMAPAKEQVEPGTPFPDTPPAGFGRRTLAAVCTEYHLNIPATVRKLGEKGIKAVNPGLTFKEIAAANDMDPHALFEVLHDAATE
jgi:hypothetical protein